MTLKRCFMFITFVALVSAQCRTDQYRCRDGTCISFDGKCDGVVNCSDGSDETHALCRGTRCHSHLFRCTYGACVDSTAPCNRVKECADNSDELLPSCRNETLEVQGQFTCENGEKISASDHCDGVRDCKDGSDERIESCAGKRCASYLFQCAYGACADQDAQCNNKLDCADGSDELEELCNRPSQLCVLPPYPENGNYTVSRKPFAKPGQAYDSALFLTVTCAEGHRMVGCKYPYCFDGKWRIPMPECSRFCKLPRHPSVQYNCIVTGKNNLRGKQLCEEFEPNGIVVDPVCKSNYYYSGVLSYMKCNDGTWDYVAICQPDCGKLTPIGGGLIINGWTAKHGELPWHAGIYDKHYKKRKEYTQICGGSLVSTTVVISAAHCFWNDETSSTHRASKYAVALGKFYRRWNHPNDTGVQKSDVSKIWIPVNFASAETSFQDDIALVILSTQVVLANHILPICINFDLDFDDRQLTPGNTGKVAGWGLIAEDGGFSKTLQTTELPVVELQKCIGELPSTFRTFITSDKMCAGRLNGTALCKGDSGGGLAFTENDRCYLRGVVSTAPRNNHKCNAFTYTTFTRVRQHEGFIKSYLKNDT